MLALLADTASLLLVSTCSCAQQQICCAVLTPGIAREMPSLQSLSGPAGTSWEWASRSLRSVQRCGPPRAISPQGSCAGKRQVSEGWGAILPGSFFHPESETILSFSFMIPHH